MFVIRAEQIAVFDEMALGRFVASCTEIVHASSAAAFGHAEAAALVRDTLRICQNAGIRREDDIVRVLRLRLLVGEVFDRSLTRPEIAGLLREVGLHGTTKTDLICGQLLSEARGHE